MNPATFTNRELWSWQVEGTPGANPTTSKIFNFIASVHSGRKYFCFQNAQGYLWRCKFLQRWRNNSRS
jgi:hypothetical protein